MWSFYILFGFAFANVTHGESYCLECKEVIGRYQSVMASYEQCVARSGEQTGIINTYRGIITNGLEMQMTNLRVEQSHGTAQHS